MKVFISQPMKGLSNKEILENRIKAFEKLVNKLNNSDLELIDNTQFNAPANMKPTWYMSNDIRMMGDADIVYFINGWEDAHGCQIEHEVAIQYNIPVLHENTLDLIL